jgi:periplasmic glucans biosynthesis protein
MGFFNFILSAIAALLVATGVKKDAPALPEEKNTKVQILSPHKVNEPIVDIDYIHKKVLVLLENPYVPPESHKVKVLSSLNYDLYKNIKFITQKSLWKSEGKSFQLQFLPPGHLYNHQVYFNELVNGKAYPIYFTPTFFDWGGLNIPVKQLNNLYYSGFKIHHPINSKEHTDEFVVFQGASYFRVVSKGQVYGLSARGLGINTGLPNEEFPIFKEFWIEKPGLVENKIKVIAIIDSPSVVGFFEMDFYPGEPTETIVKSTIYLRDTVNLLALAPLTSMFWYGENTGVPSNQIYPEVHDSDGLLIQTDKNDWIWRVLDNPKKPSSHLIKANNFKGFGLLQRDREFSNYEDNTMKYHLRPSSWIEPIENMERGNIHLFRFPTNQDSDDNIVAFFQPEEQPEPKTPYTFSYKIKWPNKINDKKKSIVYSTRSVFDKVEGRTFFIDFKGPILNIQGDDKILPFVETFNEPIEIHDISVNQLEDLERWRLSFKIPNINFKNTELRAYLVYKQEKISETWTTQLEK